ncbi:MAG: hypothetical protein ACI88H_000104 [Cocleimonas sp.]|jgi:hypothetical protein
MSQERLFIYLRERIEWAFSCDNKSNALDGGNIIAASFGSKCLVPPWAFSQTPFVHAVNKLDDNEKALVKFVIGLQVTEREMSNLLVPLWFNFFQQYQVYHRLNSATVPKAQRLLEFALMNYKLSIAQQPSVSSKEIKQAISITDNKSFNRDWKPRLNVMHTVIAEMEHVALHKVVNCIDNERTKYA